jgi:hypothetical protein
VGAEALQVSARALELKQPLGSRDASAARAIDSAFADPLAWSEQQSVVETVHCSYKTEYTDLVLKSIAAFLTHQGDAPGQFLVGSGGSLTRLDWIDWQAPTLQ